MKYVPPILLVVFCLAVIAVFAKMATNSLHQDSNTQSASPRASAPQQAAPETKPETGLSHGSFQDGQYEVAPLKMPPIEIIFPETAPETQPTTAPTTTEFPLDISSGGSATLWYDFPPSTRPISQPATTQPAAARMRISFGDWYDLSIVNENPRDRPTTLPPYRIGSRTSWIYGASPKGILVRLKPTDLPPEAVEEIACEDRDLGKHLYEFQLECHEGSEICGDGPPYLSAAEVARIRKLGFDSRAQEILQARGIKFADGDVLIYDKAGDFIPVNIKVNEELLEPRVTDYTKDELAVLKKLGWLKTVQVIKEPGKFIDDSGAQPSPIEP